MAIQEVNYTHLVGPHNNGITKEFKMHVSYPGNPPAEFFTPEQFQQDRSWLKSAPLGKLRTFIIGTFTGFFDPSIGRLPDHYEELITTLHGHLEGLDIQTYSCFRREKFGRLGITSEHATVLDKLALDTSDFLTLLPGASNSAGTWKEIVHATQKGTRIVGLFHEGQPEEDFQEAIMRTAAASQGNSPLTYVTFGSTPHLLEQLTEVVKKIPAGSRA